jgi:hypothetical protein
MKNFKPLFAVGLGLACALVGVPLMADAIKDGYVSYSQSASTNVAQVIFPSAPLKTIRLVSVDVLGGTAAATMQIMGGTTVTSLLATNGISATSTTLVVRSTSGFVSNDVVVVQGTNDFLWQGVLFGTNSGTNLYFTMPPTNAFPTNAFVYRMSDVFTTIVSNSTVRVTGPSLYGAQRRKPVLVRVNGSSSVVNNVTAHYDDN